MRKNFDRPGSGSIGRLDVSSIELERIESGDGRVVSVAGKAWSHEKSVDWSLILKIIVPSSRADEPTHYNYWKREILAYQSGLLEKLPETIRAPRCFAIEEKDDNTVWIWLEEVTDSIGPHWTLRHYEEAARLLGRFNGSYLVGEPLPDEPWLCRRWLASWVEECDKYDNKMALIEETWQLPVLRKWFPPHMFKRYSKFHQSRRQLLEGLQKLPKVLTHNDAWPPNLFRQEKSSMVAIDWAFVGIAGLGEELGRFYGLLLHRDGSLLRETSRLPDRLFEHYVMGLRDAGWNGDSAKVRFGFTASAGIRCGMMVPKLIEQAYTGTEEGPLVEDLRDRCSIAVHLLELAEEAISFL